MPLTRLLLLALLLPTVASAQSRPLYVADRYPNGVEDPTTRIACLGDSITAGGSGYAWPSILAATLQTERPSRFQVDNFGIPGDTAANMVSRWRSSIRGKGYHVVVVLAGTNDLTNGTSAATLWGYLSTIADEARADSMRVVLLTLLPRHGTFLGSTLVPRMDWSSDLQMRLESVNASIRAWWVSTGTVAVDTYAVMGDARDLTYMAEGYNGDGLHPNPTGYAVIAAAVRPALP